MYEKRLIEKRKSLIYGFSAPSPRVGGPDDPEIIVLGSRKGIIVECLWRPKAVVCLQLEIIPGIFLDNAGVESHGGKIFVGLVNAN